MWRPLWCIVLGVLLGVPASAVEEEGPIATVRSLANEAEAAEDDSHVVYTWEGVVANQTLSQVEAAVVLLFSAEDGSQVAELPLESLELARMEERKTSVVLEIDLPTWEKIYSVRAEIAWAKRLGAPQTASDAPLVSDVRSNEEKAGDLARRREQLETKIQRLERDYAAAETDYEIAKARIGPFGLANADSREAKRLERDLERASKRLQDAAQELREARRDLQELR